MNQKDRKPAIRFKAFNDPWEQRKLSELASMHARIGWQNLRTSEFLTSGNYMLITGTDFVDGAINYSTCHFVEKERYEQDKNIQIQNGSILITKDGTLGKVAYVQGLSMPATLNAGVFNVRIKNNLTVDGKYLFQYIKAPFLMDYVGKKATGGTIKHLNQNILVDFPITMPKIAEQKMIGCFLQAYDNLITLHQRKLDKLQNVKKACLEKMFPQNGESVPRIRFKGFTDTWEQRKLSSLCSLFTDGDWIESKDQSNFGIRLIQTGNIGITEFIEKIKSRKWISENTFNRLHCEAVIPGDILISRLPDPAGRACIVPNLKEKMITAVDCTIARVDAKFCASFLIQSLSTSNYFSFVNTCLAGGTRQRISRSNLSNYEVSIPSKKIEQKQIGQYFKLLDSLITLHQRKLDKLKNLKKACLEKMFV